MKERFKLIRTNCISVSEKVKWFYAFLTASIHTLLYLIIAVNHEIEFDGVLEILITSAIAALVVLSMVKKALPPYYEADANSVTVHNWWEKTRIEYSDISGICLQIYKVPYSMGGVGYAERLSIITERGLYSFDALIEPDHDMIASVHDSLQTQFDNAKLSRLKKYIMYNRSQYISGRELITDPAVLRLPALNY